MYKQKSGRRAITAAQGKKGNCEDKVDGSAEKWADLGYILQGKSKKLADSLDVGKMSGEEDVD